MRFLLAYIIAVAASDFTYACDSCYGPVSEVVHERNVRRMQPEAVDSPVGPKAPLEWGQINFLATTDTHGWLEGHLKEQNYGADWGDFVTFSRRMKQRAGNAGVDLLIVDTGDLHDGNGLSDATPLNGEISNPIFESIDYDLLTIGNHELYVSEIAYETFSNFSKFYGEKYLTSNVQIINPATGQFEYVGQKYRYFTTLKGLRIMAFGVLFDFTGNSNVSKVIKAADMINQQWFLDAVNYPEPIDLFVLLGHNPIRTTVSSSTMGLVYRKIRSLRPDIPLQAFGGHTHIRDFQVYDDRSTGLESGRYCETLGWLSMSGIKSSSYHGLQYPHNYPHPTRKATNTSTSGITYSRRYLDWNRKTFAYHALKSQDETFDYGSGLRVTAEITKDRKLLNLSSLYGCAPETYCQSCKPVGAKGNIFTDLIPTALAETVINPARSNIARYIIINTGSIRFDLVEGPFTYDDSFIVSPFDDAFQYIPSVPYDVAKNILNSLNGAPLIDKRYNSAASSSLGMMPRSVAHDSCQDPVIAAIASRSNKNAHTGITRRQTIVTAGYTTVDDFGSDGDDTPHSKIPNYNQPNYVQAKAAFPADGSTPDVVDVVFLDFFAASVVQKLNSFGGKYTISDVAYYVDKSFTTRSYLPEYAKRKWQANVPKCPVGMGVGS